MFRLGFSAEDATHRLQQRVRWEYDDTPNAKRPETLSDSAVAKIVTDTYARKPG